MKANTKLATAISIAIISLFGLTGCEEENQAGTPSSASKDSQSNSSGGFSTGINGSAIANGSTASANPADSSPFNSTSSTAASEIVNNCNSSDPEDNQWCARLRLARMGGQPPHMPVGEIPADPNVGNVFSAPIIFEETQLYIWLSSTTYSIEGYGNGYRNRQTFYFLPTGRFYYKTVMYYGQVTPEGKVSAMWGRYRFTSESGDEIELETDQGERLVLPIKYGRRNLIWDETVYGQVDWENEALRRQTGG